MSQEKLNKRRSNTSPIATRNENSTSRSIASRSSEEDEEVLTETLNEDFDSPRFDMETENNKEEISSRNRTNSVPIMIPETKILKHSNSLKKLIVENFSPLKKKLSSGGISPSSPSRKEISATLYQRKNAFASDMPESPSLLMKNYRVDDILSFELNVENKEYL